MFSVGDRIRVKGEKPIHTVVEVVSTHGITGYITSHTAYHNGKAIEMSGTWVPSGFARSAAETSSATRKRHGTHKGGRRRSQTRRA